jgi:hypothetical protein
MVPFTQAHRREGKAAMESGLTIAARARRRFKAGKPRKITNDPLTALDAMARAVKEYGRLKELMKDESETQGETSDPNDAAAALVYAVLNVETMQHEAQRTWLPVSSTNIGSFVETVNALDPTNTVFLGIIFRQLDRQAKRAEDLRVYWVAQFMGGPLAEKNLKEMRDEARLLGE